MPKFKLVISNPEGGKTQSVEVEGVKAQPLIGRRIGDVVDGDVAGLSGYKLAITGGSDKDGTPMRPNVHGGVRASSILSGGVGFKPKAQGERKRRLVRGSMVTEDIYQVNMKMVEKPAEKHKEPKAEKRVE